MLFGKRYYTFHISIMQLPLPGRLFCFFQSQCPKKQSKYHSYRSVLLPPLISHDTDGPFLWTHAALTKNHSLIITNSNSIFISKSTLLDTKSPAVRRCECITALNYATWTVRCLSWECFGERVLREKLICR